MICTEVFEGLFVGTGRSMNKVKPIYIFRLRGDVNESFGISMISSTSLDLNLSHDCCWENTFLISFSFGYVLAYFCMRETASLLKTN